MLQDVYAACLASGGCAQMMRGYGGIAHLGQIRRAVAPILGSLLARVWWLLGAYRILLLRCKAVRPFRCGQ